MHFRLMNWSMASTHLVSPQHWYDWAHGSINPNTLPEIKPELSFLPALQRRRLSLSARLMFQAAYETVGEMRCPTVFVSHDGEINRSFELWQTLLRDGDVSPTSFGLSVHNALVGQWSMLRGDTHENTALAAQQDGWELAIMEAVALLHENAEQVLVVAADEPLRHPEIMANRAPFAYAVAALLARGGDWQLSRQSYLQDNGDYFGALNWVKNMILNRNSFTQFYQNSAWRWQCIR